MHAALRTQSARSAPRPRRPLGRLLCGPALALALALVGGPAAAQDYDQFVRDFRQALSVNDGPRMAGLVKSHSLVAAWHVDEICTDISRETSEELEREAAALRVAWRAGRGTEFAENYYTYMSLLRAEDRRERARMKTAWGRVSATFDENVAGERRGSVFSQAAVEYENLAQGFELIGDSYSAGVCWAFYGFCFNNRYREPSEVDEGAVVRGYKNAMAAWDRVDLKHSMYLEIQTHHGVLTAEGHQPEVRGTEDDGGGGGSEPASPVVETGAPLVAEMTFEALEEVQQFERPNYMADEVYQMWQWLGLLEKGSTARFNTIEEGGPTVHRTEVAALGVDSDGDGQSETPIKLTGNLAVVECKLTSGGPERGWAFAVRTGIEEDTYQGLAYHMAPQTDWVNVYILGMGSVVGDLGGTPLRVIDENMDGVYGGHAWSWEYFGMTSKRYHWTLDSMVVGSSKRALPWTEYAELDGEWYQLESLDAGTRIQATPVEVPTGKLKLSLKGPAVTWLVVRGEGPYQACYYDLAASKGGVEVPAGAYTLLVGEVRKGKKQQTSKALVIAGSATPKWTVAEGKTTTVELGAPFGFDFLAERSEDGVTVQGKSVVVTGRAGERYERAWNCAPRPEISVRKKGSKKGSKGLEMEAVLDMLAMDGAGGFRFTQADPWFPLDTTVPFVGEEFEVQLFEKKNALFGKVESQWK